MKRRPNPWIAIPAVIGGGLAAWLAGTITAVSCRYRAIDGTIVTCPTSTTVVAVLAFLAVGIGVTVVMVLVYRSLAEWRQKQEGSDPR